MTLTRNILQKEELMFALNLERLFVDHWTSESVAKEFKAGKIKTPPMPHIEGVGRARRFHLPSVEAWLLEYFQKGGKP